MEILVTLVTEPDKPKVVEFSKLSKLRDKLNSVLFLWNCNSYYVDCVKKTFVINGGKKLKLNIKGDCRILYRRRNQIDLSFASETPSDKRTIWLLGLEEIGASNYVFLKISENGERWGWETQL